LNILLPKVTITTKISRKRQGSRSPRLVTNTSCNTNKKFENLQHYTRLIKDIRNGQDDPKPLGDSREVT
jgi:hypothetical protein